MMLFGIVCCFLIVTCFVFCFVVGVGIRCLFALCVVVACFLFAVVVGSCCQQFRPWPLRHRQSFRRPCPQDCRRLYLISRIHCFQRMRWRHSGCAFACPLLRHLPFAVKNKSKFSLTTWACPRIYAAVVKAGSTV